MQLINTILNDRYLILEKIGSGGMATVYKAKDTMLDRIVAVKVLHPSHLDDEDSIRKFRREARAAGSLSHYNIVGVFDVGLHEDIHYIVMELAEGKTLKDYINENGKLSEEEAIKLTLQICDALSHAHKNGVIHRDIKPQNIILNKDNNAKVADFGIARAVTTDTLTKTEDIYGSVRYFSPEQASGENVDHRTDMYSLGIVLFEMLSGRLPYKGESPIEWALKHINEKPTPIKEILPNIDENLANIVMKTLEKDPKNRFESIEELAYHLKKYRQGMPIKIEKPKTITSAKAKGNKIMTKKQKILFGVLLVAFMGVLIYWGIQWFEDYTTVPEVEVPLLVGKHMDEAGQELEALGLEVDYSTTQNHPTIEEDHVIRHKPEAGVKVKKGRVISLTISQGIGYESIPNVVGFMLSDAEEALQSTGFEIGEITEEYHSEVEEGYIIDVNPRPGTEVKVGTTVDLIVSLGQDEDTVKVPNLIGMTKFSAQEALTEAGLSVGEISENRSYEAADTVISQSIRPGINVLPETPIDFTVSDGRKP
ncbi:MAG: protein kinase domain-containing protein [Clostridia bacterium]